MLCKILAAAALCQGAPSPAALTATQTQAIDRHVESEMARQQIPGLTLGVYRNGQAVLLKGYGFANIEHDVPATPDTVMQSGSIGKTFTATLVMMLVEQGKLRLDDSVRTHLTGLPESWQGITIAQLLSHTSGISDYDSEALTGPIVEHDGAWQGFTSYFAKYLGAGVTVAVFTNLHSDHSRPDLIGHAVAGLVDARLGEPETAVSDSETAGR